MSLFPAYTPLSKNVASVQDGVSSSGHVLDEHEAKDLSNFQDKDWIKNQSYKIKPAYLHEKDPQNIERNKNDSISSQHKILTSSSSHCDSSSSEERHRYHFKPKKKKKRTTRSRSRSPSRSRSKERRKYKRLSASRSRSGSRSYFSGSRSVSRSPRNCHGKWKKRKHKKDKNKRKECSDKLREIPKFTPYKTFFEDFNIKDENELRYAEDRYSD